MVPMPPRLSLVFLNGSTLSVLSIYCDLSESYNAFCKKENLKLAEFREVMSFPAFRLLYNPKVSYNPINPPEKGYSITGCVIWYMHCLRNILMIKTCHSSPEIPENKNMFYANITSGTA